jgi:hypothetical protein
MEFEESIYNLIPKEQFVPAKPKRHKSVHPANLPPTGSTFCIKTTSKPGVANLNGEYDPKGSLHTHQAAGLTFGKPKGALKPETTKF